MKIGFWMSVKPLRKPVHQLMLKWNKMFFSSATICKRKDGTDWCSIYSV